MENKAENLLNEAKLLKTKIAVKYYHRPRMSPRQEFHLMCVEGALKVRIARRQKAADSELLANLFEGASAETIAEFENYQK